MANPAFSLNRTRIQVNRPGHSNGKLKCPGPAILARLALLSYVKGAKPWAVLVWEVTFVSFDVNTPGPCPDSSSFSFIREEAGGTQLFCTAQVLAFFLLGTSQTLEEKAPIFYQVSSSHLAVGSLILLRKD